MTWKQVVDGAAGLSIAFLGIYLAYGRPVPLWIIFILGAVSVCISAYEFGEKPSVWRVIDLLPSVGAIIAVLLGASAWWLVFFGACIVVAAFPLEGWSF